MSNKKIALNTIALYLRLIITLVVSLFTTRLVLNNLGAQDYGLYGTVGGIVALISFIQTALSTATNRFFNIAMVKNEVDHVRRLFVTSFFLHIGIAIFISLILEIIGSIAISHYIILPINKIDTAQKILHLSVLSLFILIITIPFEALLIAKENFKAYAFISIFDTFFKLLVSYLLIYFADNRLIYYSLGLLLATIITRCLYVRVVRNQYIEAKLKGDIDKLFLKKIFEFVSWDLYGNFSVILKTHGITLIMNNFFGLIMVASIQIGNQIMGALGSFSGSFLMAVRPQLMRSYAENDIRRMNELTIYASKYSYYLLLLLCAPVLMNIDYILKIWLVHPPKYSKPISILMILSVLVNSIFLPLNSLIHATGNIKGISLITGSVILISVPIIYILFLYGFNYYWAFIIESLIILLAGIVNLIITKKLIPEFDSKGFINYVLLNLILVSIVLLFLMRTLIYLELFEYQNFSNLLILGVITASLTLLVIFIVGLEKNSKKTVLQFIVNKFNINSKVRK
nr:MULTISPECIES: MATE family efflux transporter [Moraxella]